MRLLTTTRFKRDLKKSAKRGKDLDKLWAVVETLLSGRELSARHRPHRLSGKLAFCWECHIEPDWLLIWDYQGCAGRDQALVLVRTGTHTDLFD